MVSVVTHDVDEDDLIVDGDIGSYVGGIEKDEHDDRQELRNGYESLPVNADPGLTTIATLSPAPAINCIGMAIASVLCWTP